MKKYPFSTKAAKAMIAATIAFTPIATTAGLFGADKAEAATVLKTQADWHFDSTKNVADYSNAIYNGIKTNSDVAKVSAALDQITPQEWYTIVSPILEPGVKADPNKTAEVQAAAILLKSYIGIYLQGLDESEINEFINDTSLNFSNAVPADYLSYLENAEEQLYEEYKIQTTDNENDTAFELYTSAVQSLKSAVDESGKIKGKIQETIYLGDGQKVNDSALAFLTALHSKDSTIKISTLRNATLTAAGQWDSLYDQTNPNNGNPNPGPGPGPGPIPGKDPIIIDGGLLVTPGVTEGSTEVLVTIPTDLQGKISTTLPTDAEAVVIEVPNREDGKPVVLDLPASLAAAIKAKAPAADIVINAGDVRYVIPLSQVDLTALAAGLGGNLSALTLRINIDQLTDAETTSLEDLIQAKAAGASAASSETKAAAIVSDIEVKAPAVKVKVELAQNGTVLSELKSFGNVYVNQELTIDGSVNTNNATGVVVAADGSLKALPTTFKTVDNKQVAVVGTLANSNGTYTVIESSVTFPDVDNGENWAEKYIETLSSKFIIAGTTAGTYKPDQDMTRSQFAVLLSRALGLPGTTAYDGRFKDVKGNEWFNANGEFMAAVKYGIIAGKPNGTFAPDDKVTRAEAAAMIGRALELDFIDFDESQLNKNKKLTDFKDVKEIGASTREEVLKVYQAGIMEGAGNKEFNPNDNTKRDQMAKILAEFLIKADLMDNIK
ncbi:S-layer homology domain-containing protein [Domibacillus robiginosus]|uniref:S-layer homology domain-containing protein n=1 Tax=Domibacillus robiginosus TaxID=1071054 RepID=UPI0012E0A357|nr:S-layer homology domain-containing protein [Domibacillus robiginosus]